MRVLVAAPPKSGNVWMDQLLRGMYALQLLENPPPTVDAEFREWARGEFPDDAIVHQHYRPSERILTACDELDIQIVTTLRNPYDQFVSLYFYVQRFSDRFRNSTNPALEMVGRPIDDPAVIDFVLHGFRSNLEIGTAWLASERSAIVRYEALIEKPEEALLALADELAPVDPDVVRRAIEDAKPDRMRALNKHVHAHIRSATTGDWRNHLSDTHLEAMTAHADLIEQLGYRVEEPRRGRRLTHAGRRRGKRRATTPFVILSLGQGGPTHLRYLIDSHPDVRCYGELFDPEDAYYATSGLTDHHRYLAEFDPSETGSVIGFELSWDSIRSYPQVLDLFHDPRRRVLRVRQQNRLAHFVAAVLPGYLQYQHEENCDEPLQVRIDIDQCLTHLHEWFVTDRILDELTRDRRTLDVEHEDLDDPVTQAAVQRFLGATPGPLSSPLKRQPARPLRDVIENWDEVESVLRGTVWGPFLDD